MGAGQFQGTAQADGKVRAYDTQGVDVPFGSRWFRGYLREQLGSVLMEQDIGQERILKGGLAFSLDGRLLCDDGPGPFPHNIGGLAVNAQGAVAASTLTPETFLAAIGLLNVGAMTKEYQPAGLFNEPLFQGIGYDFKDFRRASEALQFDKGVWRALPPNTPRFEDGMLLMEPLIVNKSSIYNWDPDELLTGITGNIIKNRVYDPGLIGRAGLTQVCPSGNVIEVSPSTANDEVVSIRGSTFSAIPHTGSVFVNTFGTPVHFGIGNDRGIFSTHGMERIAHTVMDPGSNDTLTFLLQNQQKIQFLLTQLESFPIATSPIRTAGTGGLRDGDKCKWNDPGV